MDSLYIVKYLCVLNQTRGWLIFSGHRHSDSEFFLNEGIRQTPQQPAWGGAGAGMRDEHKAFFLGNASLDFKCSVQREEGLINSSQVQREVMFSSPRFQMAICLILAFNVVFAVFKAILI